MTVSLLIQLDKLVQFIESPLFTTLRLQLLHPSQYPYLIQSLYAILMILPQSNAFQILKKRLACLNSWGFLTSTSSTSSPSLSTSTTSTTSSNVATPNSSTSSPVSMSTGNTTGINSVSQKRSSVGMSADVSGGEGGFVNWNELTTLFKTIQRNQEKARKQGLNSLLRLFLFIDIIFSSLILFLMEFFFFIYFIIIIIIFIFILFFCLRSS